MSQAQYTVFISIWKRQTIGKWIKEKKLSDTAKNYNTEKCIQEASPKSSDSMQASMWDTWTWSSSKDYYAL